MKLLLLVFISFSALAHQSVMTKIEDLNSVEPYAPMVFHSGFLWLGRADYSEPKTRHRIDVRSGDGETLLGSHPIPHSVERLYPFDEKNILVAGKAYTDPEGWVTYYSLVSACCGAISVKTEALPSKYQVEEFAKFSNRLFFTEVGDRAVIEKTEKGTTPWQLEISGPGKMQVLGNDLYVLERNTIYLGDENIVRLNLSTMKPERIFSNLRNGITQLLALSDGKTLALNELKSQQVLLVDSTNPFQKPRSVSLSDSSPRALGQWLNCLIVASEDSHKLSFVDLRSHTPTVLGEVSLEGYQEELPNLRGLTVNPETGAVFLRSSRLPRPWESLEGKKNSVYRFTHSFWTSQCE